MLQIGKKQLGFIVMLVGIVLFILFCLSPFIANQISSKFVDYDSILNIFNFSKYVFLIFGVGLFIFGHFILKNLNILSKIAENKWIVLGIFGLFLVYLYIKMRYGINILDEGLSSYGALRVLNGEFPYRHFFALYAPGQFYFLAFMFKIFGPSLIIGRIISRIILILMVIFIYVLAKKISSKGVALVCLLFGILCVGISSFYSLALPTATLLCLVVCLILIKYIYEGGKSYLILAGIINGVATIFRQDFGFYMFLAGSIALFAFHYVNKYKIFNIFKNWLFYFIGLMIIAIPSGIYFLKNIPIKDMLLNMVTFPLGTYPDYRELPYPFIFPSFSGENIVNYFINFIENVIFYFPIVVFLFMGLFLVLRYYKKRTLLKNEIVLLLLLLVGLGLFNHASVRSDVPHLFPALVFSVVLFGFILHRFTKIRINSIVIKGNKVVSVLLILFFILSLFSFGLHNAKANFSFVEGLSSNFVPLELERSKGIYVNSEQAFYLKDVIAFIQANVPEDEKIFVGNPRHDKIFMNDIMFYFLSERGSATKYHEMHPGFATTEKIQLEIIEHIKDVDYIVIWNDAEIIKEPNLTDVSSGVFVLDNFIKENYVLVEAFGPYDVLIRKHNQ